MRFAAPLLAILALAGFSPAAAQSRTEELMSSRDSGGGLDASSIGYLAVNTGTRRNYGSAALIGPCHIKTAAHMFRSRPVGELNLRAAAKVSFGYERNGEDIRFASSHVVTSVSVNPAFNPSRTQQPAHDVAVARIEPCVERASVAIDRSSTIDEIGRMNRRFAVVGFVPDKDLRPRLFAQRGCLWTGDGDALGILLNCRGRSGMSGGSVFMADGGGLVDVGVFTSSVSVKGKTYGAFSPLSANRAILP
jgi:V8-like Glu-specific endopeptidase